MQFKRTIEVLSPSVIEKIAAGEVVERPSAVVKELVENSIDAGATRIQVVIENAGFSLIKIIDNGFGMSQDNLRKCMLRHATSKIRGADDLFSIGTLGFRGEALGSIGAVSKMSIASSSENDGCGYCITDTGGEIADTLIPQAHSRGTTITVAELFYNVPARKKFMKSQRGEHLAIVRMLEQLVIPFPSVHFLLQIDGKTVFDLPVCNTLLERIAGVAGHEFAANLIECQSSQEHMELTAFVSSPEILHERPRFQSLYVNLRRINNDSVQYSVKEAFGQFLGHHHRPAYFTFLSIDPGKVDVNVHPTKQQIKFDNEREIFSFVFSTVKKGLAASMVHREELDDTLQGVPSPHSEAIHDEATSPPNAPGFISDRNYDTTTGVSVEISGSMGVAESLFPAASQTILQFPGSNSRIEKAVDRSGDNTVQLSGDVQDKMWDLIPCYQIHGMFILAPIKNGILLIDQHAAHERILFEQAMQKSTGIRTTSQQLLFPIVMELTPAEKGIVESGSAYFAGFGFEIADFGGNTISVSAIPAFINDGLVESTIRDMVGYLMEGKNPGEFNEPQKRFAAAFACGAAIKAGQKLTQEEMNSLLNNLFATENPYTCPHGRPTLVRMSVDELSRRFLR